MADAHWSQIGETTKSVWKFRFMLWTAIHMPQKAVEIIAAVIVFWDRIRDLLERCPKPSLHNKEYDDYADME